MKLISVFVLCLSLSACASLAEHERDTLGVDDRVAALEKAQALSRTPVKTAPEALIQPTADVPEARHKPLSYVINYVDGSKKVCVVKPIYHLDGSFAYMNEECW